MAKVLRDNLALKLDTNAITEGQRRAEAFVIGTQPNVWDTVVLQGISQSPRGRLAIVNGQTVASGENFRITVDGTSIDARCGTITGSKAIIVIGNEAKVLTLVN